MNRILVLGFTGYVGSHIVSYLTRLGYQVECLSREEFEDKNYYRLQGGDILINAAWTRQKDLHSLEHLDFARDVCSMYQYCHDNGIRVLNLGSHAEYSIGKEPSKEIDLCEPVTTYGIAKLMVTLYAKNMGFNTLRLFAVYGGGGRTFRDVVGLHNAKFAMPENAKDFVPVEQVCYAVERLIHMPHVYGEIVNVASGFTLTAEELASEVQGVEEKWHQYAQRQFESPYGAGDVTKMKELLNLNPK